MKSEKRVGSGEVRNIKKHWKDMTRVRNSQANVILKERLRNNGKETQNEDCSSNWSREGQGRSSMMTPYTWQMMKSKKFRDTIKQKPRRDFFFLNAKLSAAARLHIFHHSHTPCSTFSANKLECSGYVTVCEMEPITDYSSTKTKQPFIRQASIPDLKN